MTYAAGLEAAKIVWVAQNFSEEHRAALDWLNRITDDRFIFFGVEIELWKIDGTVAAPRFNVVSVPNDWLRSVADAARLIDEQDLSETKAMQKRYWTEFQKILATKNGPVSANRKPQPQSWMGYRLGRSGFLVSAVMVRATAQLRAEIYIQGRRGSRGLPNSSRGKPKLRL
jgi:hypothetical protein